MGGKMSSVKRQAGIYALWLKRYLWQERNTDERVQLALQESYHAKMGGSMYLVHRLQLLTSELMC